MNSKAMRKKPSAAKKRIRLIILSAVIVAVIVAAALVYVSANNQKRYQPKAPIPLSDFFDETADLDKITLIAHRGFSCQAPENSTAAIEKSAEYGFDIAEIDIRQTADGVWVVSHDDSIKAMTDKSGKISEYTYSELSAANIDNGSNHQNYSGLKIATLEEILSVCAANDITPMIEIKSYTDSGLDDLIHILEKYGIKDTCSVISFDREALSKVRERDKGIKLYALISELDDEEMQKCLSDPTVGVSFNGNARKNTPDKIKQLQSANIPLACWTIDSGETVQKYYDIGITTFVTNRIYK